MDRSRLVIFYLLEYEIKEQSVKPVYAGIEHIVPPIGFCVAVPKR